MAARPKKVKSVGTEYHGEFLHAMVIGVTTMPNRTLSFQVIFTGSQMK